MGEMAEAEEVVPPFLSLPPELLLLTVSKVRGLGHSGWGLDTQHPGSRSNTLSTTSLGACPPQPSLPQSLRPSTCLMLMRLVSMWLSKATGGQVQGKNDLRRTCHALRQAVSACTAKARWDGGEAWRTCPVKALPAHLLAMAPGIKLLDCSGLGSLEGLTGAPHLLQHGEGYTCYSLTPPPSPPPPSPPPNPTHTNTSPPWAPPTLTPL